MSPSDDAPRTIRAMSPHDSARIRRILYAAARDRNFFALFGRLHATEAYPVVSLLFLGGVAAIFCWIPLKDFASAKIRP